MKEDKLKKEIQIIFRPHCVVHYFVDDKNRETYLSGYNWIGEKCVGTTNIKLTEEEMKVIDDVITGASRRKNILNNN